MPSVVKTINQGRAHIIEPGLSDLLREVVSSGSLVASTSPEPADAFIIAVPTPFDDMKAPDISLVQAAINSISSVLKAGDLIVIESPCPVGTTELVADWLSEIRPDLLLPCSNPEEESISIAHCPERVLPGQVLREIVENDRIIGGLTRRCAEKSASLYDFC